MCEKKHKTFTDDDFLNIYYIFISVTVLPDYEMYCTSVKQVFFFTVIAITILMMEKDLCS